MPSADGNAAKRLELRARVEQRGEEHVAGETADAVEVRGLGSLAAPCDAGRDRPGAEPVVDAHDRERPPRTRRASR